MVLFASVFPTLTFRPMPSKLHFSLAESNTVLTIVSGGRVIVKLLSLVKLFDVIKRYPGQSLHQSISFRVMTLSVAQLVYEVPPQF